MTQNVWKYEWPEEPYNDAPDTTALFEMPDGAVVLKIDLQYRKIAIWAFVPDVYAPKTERTFFMAGTGHTIASGVSASNYIGSVLLNTDSLVLHFFEVKP